MMDISWILTFVVAFITWYFTRQWMQRRALPPGPYPIPVLGNLLSLRGVTMDSVMAKFRRQYGGVFTLWFGSVPFVIVTEYQLIKEALVDKKNDFAGRLQLPMFKQFMVDKISITNGEPTSQAWVIFRKMGHSAIRKYAVSHHLPPLIDDLTEEAVDQMLQQKEPFHSMEIIYHLTFNIVTSTVIGQRYKSDDPVFTNFRKWLETFQKYMSKGVMGYLMPVLRPFVKKSEIELMDGMVGMRNFIVTKTKEHMDTYQPNDVRDMIDSLLFARDEIVAELGAENVPLLTGDSIFHVIIDIFGAAIDTSSSTVRWILLFCCLHPEVQEKIIEELRNNIGDRVPTQDDRKRCAYTCAVISESMRFKAIAPYGLPHRTLCDTEIGGYKIPNDTALFFQYGAVHADPEFWKNPDEFVPERFLESDGDLADSRKRHFLPFGIGRRNCIGEKLATENIFLVVAGIFRRCRLSLKTPPEDLESQSPLFMIPKHHTMVATRLDT